jgi:flagellar basal body-associated protein FliL
MIFVGFFVLLALVIPALCIWAAVDASGKPDWAFEAAQTSKTLWIVLPIVGIFVCLVGLIASIMWFSTYKPRVEQAARGGPGYPPPRPYPYS